MCGVSWLGIWNNKLCPSHILSLSLSLFAYAYIHTHLASKGSRGEDAMNLSRVVVEEQSFEIVLLRFATDSYTVLMRMITTVCVCVC